MGDMGQVTAPKTDQLSADMLLGTGDMTIRVTGVRVKPGEDQPCDITFEGSDLFYRPSLGMRRVLMQAWGRDTADYIGRSIRLYRDPDVTFGKDQTGGVRIRALSHIDKAMTFAITVKRGARKPYTVQPLRVEPKADEMDPAFVAAAEAEARDAAGKGTDPFKIWWSSHPEKRGAVKPHLESLKAICAEADAAAAPEPELDVFGLPPLPTDHTDRQLQATDAEIAEQIERETGEGA